MYYLAFAQNRGLSTAVTSTFIPTIRKALICLRFVVVWYDLTTSIKSVCAQHCGGPCEVPRGADPISANPAYTLSEGMEKGDWRYLHNWFWTVNGEQKSRVESALKSLPARDFGFRRMFVSPSGNGFLVTGNAYAERYLKGKEPPLFLFFAPSGNRLSEVSLFEALKPKSRKVSQCPNCDCDNVLYIFAQEPTLSENGCFVEVKPYQAAWPIWFYLPFGCPVENRWEFEKALEAAEWSRLSSEQASKEKIEIQALISGLNSDDLKVRTGAAASIASKGYLAKAAINKAEFDSNSGNFRARAKSVASKLRPLGGLEWEAMSNDLGLLVSMLSFSETKVVQSIQQRLVKIIPPLEKVAPEEYGKWITERRLRLKWNASMERYEE